MTLKANKEMNISEQFYREYKIERTREMRCYICTLDYSDLLPGFPNLPSLNQTDIELSFKADEWNEFLKYRETSFLNLLEEGELQSLAMDLNGDNFYSAHLPLLKAKKYLREILGCTNLSNSTMEKLQTILNDWTSPESNGYFLGIDIYKIKENEEK